MLLNVNTVYTLLESTVEIEGLVKTAQQRGYQAVGIADVNVLHGAYELYQVAIQNEMKPLIGLTVSMPGVVRQERDFKFILYAIDYTGYQALIKISYYLSETPVNQQAIWQLVDDFSEHLVYISADRQSELEQAIIRDEVDQADKILKNITDRLSTDHIFLGTAIYPYNQLEIEKLRQFSSQYGIKLVVTQAVNTINEDDAFSLRVFEAIKANDTELDRSLVQSKGTTYIYEQGQLVNMYQDAGLEKVVQNTRDLIERLNVKLPAKQNLLPKFETPQDMTPADFLRSLTLDRLDTLGLSDQDAYTQQVDHELSIIHEMGFDDYFLIVWDIINYCRKEGIRMGPGRGSAAGSLVAYLLQITAVDPLEFGLLFERFLNPKRVSMPDIDIDIPDNKRDQVFAYIEKRYGHDQVAHIITFGTFGAKQAIRDTLRVFGASSDELRQWSRAIPTDQNQAMTLERAYKMSDPLRQLVEYNPANKEIFKVALTLEGLPRQTSTHAAAVVINDFPLVDVIPVMERPNQLMVTQFTMYDVEDIGLLKMDFLGLRNLTILDDIIRNIEKIEQKEVDLEAIPINDAETLALFQAGNTNGVFQFESDGIKSVLKRLVPESFEDIVAVNALYRPGPMKQIDSFIKRKQGKEPVSYIVPDLEPILANTYGIIVYQEQVIQILVKMGQFDLGEADVLRNAMSKKQTDVMESERAHFLNGAKKQGHSEEEAAKVYNYIYEFSNYGFNRAHAVVYSTLAYQLAYFKVHYPVAFYVSILNNGSSNRKTQVEYIQEAKKQLGDILGVDINRSLFNYSVDKEKLRIGFNSIKSMRKELAEHIIDDRNQLGIYTDMIDFIRRLPGKFLKKEYIEPLIDVGALDTFGYNRATLATNLSKLIQSIEFSGQNMSLFQEMEPRIEWVSEWPELELLNREKEVLGFALSGHPLDQFDYLYQQIPNLLPIEEIETKANKAKVQLLGLLTDKRVIQTKKGQPMAFVTVSNDMTDLSLVVFPNIYQNVQRLLEENAPLLVTGTVDTNRRNEKQVIVNRLQLANEIDKENQQNIKYCFIQVTSFQSDAGKINQVKQLSLDNPGPAEIILVDQEKETFKLNEPYQISYSKRIQSELRQIFGSKSVVFK